jgi:hypothetical protein
MLIEIKKAVINGRNRNDQAIYPCGSWTVWKDGSFIGWNWEWSRVWKFVWDKVKV